MMKEESARMEIRRLLDDASVEAPPETTIRGSGNIINSRVTVKGGRLAAGMAADVTIFDLDTVGPAGRQRLVKDLPGSGERFVVPANGIEYTIVNGEVLYEHRQHTGALPGTVLRSQRIN